VGGLSDWAFGVIAAPATSVNLMIVDILGCDTGVDFREQEAETLAKAFTAWAMLENL
jgi:hypothetical protein